MKESISYTFVLNIVILFIFVCAAIIMGIFSYYRAFKANTIIINSIEKYEGYNCHSKEEIERKLNTISYNVPFQVKCKSGDTNCTVDSNSNYAVVSYNLDGKGKFIYDDNMNSQYECAIGTHTNCSQTRNYQYGVYTYMYVDVPVVSSLIRIPFFSKTKIMYEHRNIMLDSGFEPIASEWIPDEVIKKSGFAIMPNEILSTYTMELYAIMQTGGQIGIAHSKSDPEYSAREKLKMDQLDIDKDGYVDASDSAWIKGGNVYKYQCGKDNLIDYSKY